jgi:hypothetical protein
MRKFVLLLAILALPGLAMAQMDVSSPDDLASDGLADGVITIAPAAGQVITIDVATSAGTTVNSTLQYSLTANAADAGLDYTALAQSPMVPPQYFSLFYFGGVGLWSPSLVGSSMAVVNTTVAEGYNVSLASSGLVATWTLTTNASLAPGTYVIQADSLVFASNSIDGVPMGGTGQHLTLNVVPEPATALLLLGALPFLRRRR